jgi:hypothetical protein
MGGDFRVGRIFDRAMSIYTRNFLTFSLVTLVASAAPLLVPYYAGSWSSLPVQDRGTVVTILTTITSVVLGLLSQSILVYGAFQVLRGRSVNLLESMKVGLRRFFPILGLIIFVALAFFMLFTGMMLAAGYAGAGLSRLSPGALLFIPPTVIILVGFLLLFIATLMLIARWFVVIPVCMVERFGPWRSLKRSAGLTQGRRWKISGIILVLFVCYGIIAKVIAITTVAVGGKTVELIASLLWSTVWSAFFAILVVVTYYELRSAKDGADIEQIAGVFD